MASSTLTALDRAAYLIEALEESGCLMNDKSEQIVTDAIENAEQAASEFERNRIASYFERVLADQDWTAREIAAAVRDGWDCVPNANAQPAADTGTRK